jgi:predicted nucleotidyltransferase
MTHAPRTDSFDEKREAGYEAELRKTVLEACTGLSCEVFLFGSRARGTARRASDFDVGILGLSPEEFARVKRIIEDRVEEGPIPHEVDVVDFERATEPFRTPALEGRVVWKND